MKKRGRDKVIVQRLMLTHLSQLSEALISGVDEAQRHKRRQHRVHRVRRDERRNLKSERRMRADATVEVREARQRACAARRTGECDAKGRPPPGEEGRGQSARKGGGRARSKTWRRTWSNSSRASSMRSRRLSLSSLWGCVSRSAQRYYTRRAQTPTPRGAARTAPQCTTRSPAAAGGAPGDTAGFAAPSELQLQQNPHRSRPATSLSGAPARNRYRPKMLRPRLSGVDRASDTGARRKPKTLRGLVAQRSSTITHLHAPRGDGMPGRPCEAGQRRRGLRR